MHIWITRSVARKRIPCVLLDDKQANAVEQGRSMFTWAGWVYPRDDGIIWHRSPDAAVARVNAMRDEKLAQLRASIEKYEAIVYTAQKAM